MKTQDNKSFRTSISKATAIVLSLGGLVLGSLFYLSNTNIADLAEAQNKTTPIEDAASMGDIEGEVRGVVSDIEQTLADDQSAFENPKVQLLSEIIESRNDNDPRLDSEFKDLNEEDKKALRAFYHQLELEDRNGRGTAVFLLGREIKSSQDLDFFSEVLSEQPCLSLYDCEAAEPPEMAHVDEHDQSQDITLAYPQIVAVRSLENALSTATGETKDRIIRQLQAAVESQMPTVSKQASQILSRTQAKRSL